jgi:hypothetical protein
MYVKKSEDSKLAEIYKNKVNSEGVLSRYGGFLRSLAGFLMKDANRHRCY